jgi:hypothetical protein
MTNICSKTLARHKQEASWSFLSPVAIYYGVVHVVYAHLLHIFYLGQRYLFSNSKKGSVPHEPVLSGPNLFRARLAIVAQVGGSANMAHVICFFAKMRYVLTSGTHPSEASLSLIIFHGRVRKKSLVCSNLGEQNKSNRAHIFYFK